MLTLILGWAGISLTAAAVIVALWFFGPTVIWAFFATRLGRILLVIGAVCLLSLGIGQTFYNKAKRECAAANKQREIEIAQRDVKIGELLASLDQKNIAEQAKDKEKDDEFQRKLEAELAKRPVAAQCRATDDDVRRLR
ncbi:hypothetical protein AB8A05_04260 [Tardiphaga sp. 538_B7_N1_4]|uniref:hypothetical protein n=1 Tax=Tardiphaga sp. 538_B7_N1_4 TaxID=3240778 RepID=UPI003F2033E0